MIFLPSKASDRSRPLRAQAGLTLIEVSIALSIIGLLGLAASQLMFTGAQTQISFKTHEVENNLAQEIVNKLRYDLRSARNIRIINSGSGLQFDAFNPSTNQYLAMSYVYDGTALYRNGVDFAANRNPVMKISCGNSAKACFSGTTSPVTGSQNLQSISLNYLTITDNSNATKTLDQAFGMPATFRLEEASFDILNGTTFQ